MKYQSTRSKAIIVDGHRAIIQGLADDGGLYIPEEIPHLLNAEEHINDTYQETAEAVLSVFFDDLSKEDIRKAVHGAYDKKFDDPTVVPLTQFKDGFLMDLWHGPTCAFKDIALTILPYLLTSSYRKDDRSDTVSILTATSGDTGKAALSGFADVEHTAVTVFYPEEGVSEIQKKQMRTSRGENLCVIGVQGNFDDCQRLVKEACSNPAVLNACKGVTISSANSINIGRLIPQVVYYITSYCRLRKDNVIKEGEEINFVVPTGNFGDILAGYIAKQMGLPIHKLICASNRNNVLTDFIRTGTYSLDRDFHKTSSPSMDILISSNLERLLSFLTDRNAEQVAGYMEELQTKGCYTVDAQVLERLQNDFAAYYANEEDCMKEIHDLYHNEHITVDPHTAVGLHALHAYRKETEDSHVSIVLSTASPYKFPHAVLSAIQGKDCELSDDACMEQLHLLSGVKIPESLAELNDLPIRFSEVIAKENGIKRIIERMQELSND